jgi:hypothetical protein
VNEQVQSRLADLRREYELGQRRLQELLEQEVAIRETLLRISGAIQVLEELTGRATSTQAGAPLPEPPAVPAQDAEPPAPGTALQVG